VQAKIAANAVRLKGSPAVLTGLIFDDRSNRMSLMHSNKLGARYRYYVSHPILQQRKAAAGSITRVLAVEIETLVVDGVREEPIIDCEAEYPHAIADRYLIERHVDCVIVKHRALEGRLVSRSEASAQIAAEPRINHRHALAAGDNDPCCHGQAPCECRVIHTVNARNWRATVDEDGHYSFAVAL
jgi:site-specific DNA recombinase